MRVIAGDARGRKLKAPKNRSVRPTADRVKEALFNIIAADIEEAKVLDLFAGTGNLTIEALSRGAADAVLVDFSTGAAKMISENLARLGLARRATVITARVARALRGLARQRAGFDIIFLDPPYGQELVPQTLERIAREGILRDTGLVVAEHGVRDAVDEAYASLVLTDRRRYGDTMLSFFKLKIPGAMVEGNKYGQ